MPSSSSSTLRQRPAASTSHSRNSNNSSSSSSNNSGNSGSRPKPSARDQEVDSKVIMEFGGPLGVTCLMVFFPCLMGYLHSCIFLHDGQYVSPLRVLRDPQTAALLQPTRLSAQLYLGFTLFQALTAATLPGVIVQGLPVPSLGGRQLSYLCNGIATWYLDLMALVLLHCTDLLPAPIWVDNVHGIVTVAMAFSYLVATAAYLIAVATRATHRMSHNVLYDYFMGASLNPRVGPWLDMKMFSEIRIPWKLLFLLSLSAAVKDHQFNGASPAHPGVLLPLSFLGIYTSAPFLFMTLAHGLYVNACMKGEECIPTTWDIFYEKWGYMLIFWNLAGVPLTYCHSSLYLSHRAHTLHSPVVHSPLYTALLFLVLLGAYYVWDTANSQKNRFRMQERGTYIERHTFPQLPWGTLKNPSYITTQQGSKLLTGGWWGKARKIHYTADLVMALSWGLIAGGPWNEGGQWSAIPYFYVIFFTTVLIHRVSRDLNLCKEKYGEDWDRYCSVVPYTFIPGII